MSQRKCDLEKDPIALYIARTDVVESFRCEYGGSGMLFGELPDYAVRADTLLLFLTKNIGLAHDAIKLHGLM